MLGHKASQAEVSEQIHQLGRAELLGGAAALTLALCMAPPVAGASTAPCTAGDAPLGSIERGQRVLDAAHRGSILDMLAGDQSDLVIESGTTLFTPGANQKPQTASFTGDIQLTHPSSTDGGKDDNNNPKQIYFELGGRIYGLRLAQNRRRVLEVHKDGSRHPLSSTVSTRQVVISGRNTQGALLSRTDARHDQFTNGLTGVYPVATAALGF